MFYRKWHSHILEQQILALLYLCQHIHETVKQPNLLEFFMKQVHEAIIRTTNLVARMDYDQFTLVLFNINYNGNKDRPAPNIEVFNLEYGKQQTSHVYFELDACICMHARDQTSAIKNPLTGL